MFCVITRTLVCCFLPGHVAAATCVTAKWPALGSYLRSVVLPGSATTCAGIQNLLYHARGSLRKAWRVRGALECGQPLAVVRKAWRVPHSSLGGDN